MTSTALIQTRSSMPMAPASVTRTALPGTPRPVIANVIKASASVQAIVLAWDNVLFPTKWMAECVGLLSTRKQSLDATKRACMNNPFIIQALTAIEEQVIQLLAAATVKTHVYIVADHTAATLDALCTTFYPRLKTYLSNAHGRVSIISAPASTSTESVSTRAARKLSTLQHICSTSMNQLTNQRLADGSMALFKVLTVTADELDARVATRLQEVVARLGCVQFLALPPATDSGHVLPLVDFHKQLQSVSAALATQLQSALRTPPYLKRI